MATKSYSSSATSAVAPKSYSSSARKRELQENAESVAKSLGTTKESGAVDSEKEKIRNRISAVKAPDKKGNNLVRSSMAGSAAGIAQAWRAMRNKLAVRRSR